MTKIATGRGFDWEAIDGVCQQYKPVRMTGCNFGIGV